jgi:hypothetical protein
MNYAKFVSKSSFVILAAAVCTTLAATDASAQRRGGGSGGGGGQGRSGGGQGRTDGRAAPRGSVSRGGVGPGGVSPRVIVRAPYRSYYYRPGFSLGIYAGYPYFGYGYGYPYGYYGSPYGYYGYPGYAYRGYGYAVGGYGYGGYGYGGGAYGGGAYGGIRIQGAPPHAQVFADGYYAGIVDDFDGSFQHLDLEPGPHSIEIRVPGAPPISFDVNVQPGRTVTFHAGIR